MLGAKSKAPGGGGGGSGVGPGSSGFGVDWGACGAFKMNRLKATALAKPAVSPARDNQRAAFGGDVDAFDGALALPSLSDERSSCGSRPPFLESRSTETHPTLGVEEWHPAEAARDPFLARWPLSTPSTLRLIAAHDRTRIRRPNGIQLGPLAISLRHLLPG